MESSLRRADYAAIRLDVRIQRIYELAHQNPPWAIWIGRQLRVDSDRLEEWIRSGGTQKATRNAVTVP